MEKAGLKIARVHSSAHGLYLLRISAGDWRARSCVGWQRARSDSDCWMGFRGGDRRRNDAAVLQCRVLA